MSLEEQRERDRDTRHRFILTRAYFCILTTGTCKLTTCQDDERVLADIYKCTSKQVKKRMSSNVCLFEDFKELLI